MIKSYRSRVDRGRQFKRKRTVRTSLKTLKPICKALMDRYSKPPPAFGWADLFRNKTFEPGEVVIFAMPGLTPNSSDLLGNEVRLHQLKRRQSLKDDSEIVFDPKSGRLVEE